MGLQYIPALVLPGLYFDKKRSLVTGIVASGGPAGGMVSSILIQILIDRYSWRATLALLGAISLNGVAMGILLVPPNQKENKGNIYDHEPPQPRPLSKLKAEQADMGSVILKSVENLKTMSEHPDCEGYNNINKCHKFCSKIGKLFDVSLLRDFMVAMVIFKRFFYNMGYMVLFMFLPLCTAQNNINTSMTASIMSLMALTNLFGRLGFGAAGSIPCIKSVHLFCGSAIIGGTVTLLVPFVSSTVGFSIIGGIFGFSYGKHASPMKHIFHTISLISDIFTPFHPIFCH